MLQAEFARAVEQDIIPFIGLEKLAPADIRKLCRCWIEAFRSGYRSGAVSISRRRWTPQQPGCIEREGAPLEHAWHQSAPDDVGAKSTRATDECGHCGATRVTTTHPSTGTTVQTLYLPPESFYKDVPAGG